MKKFTLFTEAPNNVNKLTFGTCLVYDEKSDNTIGICEFYPSSHDMPHQFELNFTLNKSLDNYNLVPKFIIKKGFDSDGQPFEVIAIELIY